MENEYFGIQPSALLQFEPSSSNSTPVQPNWRSVHSLTEFNSSTDHSPDSFFNPDQSMNNFESALSSLVSSPAASNSNISNEAFVIRELIGKLGNINNHSGVGNEHSQQANNSCYSTPMNSPPKLNLPNLGTSMPLSSSVAEFSADPGFAERAARFSCFGSRSFNGRTTNQLPINRPSQVIENVNLSRVSSSPSLNAIVSQLGPISKNSTMPGRSELASSQEESSVSEQIPNGDSNSRKRKSVAKGKVTANSQPANAKGPEVNTNSNGKRNKVKADEKKTNIDDSKQQNDTKPPEAPKLDYIHVRARRGQATDSHSLAERVRREKISERMKLLQDLVPGCNKVTGKALMLDEIINYVQSLQRQVEFLSMKLSSVNTRLDFNVDSLMSKDIFQSNNNTIFPIDSSASAFFSQQQQNNISNGTMPQCSSQLDPLDTTTGLCQNQLPLVHGFNQTLHQYSTLSEEDLQTIVQMGFGQNPNNMDSTLQPQSFHGSNQSSHMKMEL
ncbi:hypothetical protein ACFE04_031163 [Oxalis oulophora]